MAIQNIISNPLIISKSKGLVVSNWYVVNTTPLVLPECQKIVWKPLNWTETFDFWIVIASFDD